MDIKEKMLPAPMDGGFRMEGYWVWCGSVAKGEDGKYHMFAARWPKWLPMHPGWLLKSEIVRAVADKVEGPYTYCETVLGARGAQYWDGRMTHNPSIMKVGDKWVLYYIGSTHPFDEPVEGEVISPGDPRVIVARANKRIGMAVADHITGPWKRMDAPIMTVRPDHQDNYFVSNPAPLLDENNELLMLYKYRSYEQTGDGRVTYSKMRLNAARAEQYDGIYVRKTEQIFEEDIELEDPFIWKEAGVYQMIAKDMKGNICGEWMGGTYATSQDGIHWDMRRNYLAYSRNVLWEDGKVRLMGNLDRPFIYFEDGKPRCLFFATSDGKEDGFMDATGTWNMAIPLKQ